MYKFAFTDCFSIPRRASIILLLALIVFGYSYAEEESRMIEKKVATVFMGNEVFEIPKNYLSPKYTVPNKIKKDNMIEISFFFPDFSGFGDSDDISTVGPYNPNQVTAFWTVVNGGGRLDANNSLKNALKYGLSKRDHSLDIHGLTAYKNTNNSGVTYYAQNSQGDYVLIHCTEGSVNSTCKLEYLDGKSSRGIFASFDKKFLTRWLEINNKLLFLIDNWQIKN